MEAVSKSVVKSVVIPKTPGKTKWCYLSSYLYKREIYIISLIPLYLGILKGNQEVK